MHYTYQDPHQQQQQTVASYPHHPVPQQHQQQVYHDQVVQQQQYDLNLDSLNPSDFSIPSLSEFLDNPSASFPNLSGEVDLSHSGYITAAGHASAAAVAHQNMQFEPQIDGTFDPTSIGEQSLDGSGGGSNPTTPEKNKTTISPAHTPAPPVVQKKYCEICGKEYEGKNRSMNKVQHMVHHFKETLYESLPPKIEGDPLPFKCPEGDCKFETKHKPDWARHFGSVHKHVERLLAKYLEEHQEAWANQPENKELLRESYNPNHSKATLLPTTSVEPRPVSRISGSNSDQLDSGEGLLCKIKELQQKTESTSRVQDTLASPALNLQQGTAQTGRLAVELPKSDLTRFITSALNEKNVPHAVDQGNNKKIILSEQLSLDEKVQSVIHEQQQIIDSQKVQGADPVLCKSPPVLHLPQQPVPVTMIQQQQMKAASTPPSIVTSAQQQAGRVINRSQSLLTTVSGSPQGTSNASNQHLLATVPAVAQQKVNQQQQEKQEFRTVQIQLPPNVLKQASQGGTLQLQMPSGQRLQLQQQVTHQYLKIQTPQGEQLIRVQTQPGGQIQIARQVVQQVQSQQQQQQQQLSQQQQQQLQPQQQQPVLQIQQQKQQQQQGLLTTASQQSGLLTTAQPAGVSNNQQPKQQPQQQQQQQHIQVVNQAGQHITVQKPSVNGQESIVVEATGKQNVVLQQQQPVARVNQHLQQQHQLQAQV